MELKASKMFLLVAGFAVAVAMTTPATNQLTNTSATNALPIPSVMNTTQNTASAAIVTQTTPIALNSVQNTTSAFNSVQNTTSAANSVQNTPSALKSVQNTTSAINSVQNTTGAVNSAINTTSAVNSVQNTTSAVNSAQNTTNAVNSVQNTTNAANSVQNTTNAANSTQNTTNAVSSAQNTTRAINSTQNTTNAVSSVQNTTSAVRSVQNTTRAINSTQNTTNAVSSAQNTTSAVNSAPNTSSAVNSTSTASGMMSSTQSTTSATNSTQVSLATLPVTDNTEMVTTGQMDDSTTSSPMNCSYPGQECQNGTCARASGKCNCSSGFTGNLCETHMACPTDYCVENGTQDCFVVSDGIYQCRCKNGFSGYRCEMFDGCLANPCDNNGICTRLNSNGGYTCDCSTGDPNQNCQLNDVNDCALNPPNSIGSYITCVNLIGSRRLYCAPGYNGTECRDRVSEADHCTSHGCLDSKYCKPLCNVAICNTTDVCSKFTAITKLQATGMYDHTECRMKFADGYYNDECATESGLFDGYDGVLENIRDCSPFFDTICTRNFSNGECDAQCNNDECLFDGGDCINADGNQDGRLPGSTIVKFSRPLPDLKQTQTRLSLFARALVQIIPSDDKMEVGLVIKGPNFSNITIASKFFAVSIGKVPELLDMVTDVYVCPHGMYNNGSGSVCDQACSGTCNQSDDICDWTGFCTQGCEDNHWGRSCENMCDLECNGTCRQSDGHCVQCPDGKYGFNCELYCSQHCVGPTCGVETGECQCMTGYFRSTSGCTACSKNCREGQCSNDGNCENGCVAGFYGDKCSKPCGLNCKGGLCFGNSQCTGGCVDGYYGNMCTESCSANCKEKRCSLTGQCAEGCMDGYYGNMCTESCSANCKERRCSLTGQCAEGCMDGYYGNMCTESCSANCQGRRCLATGLCSGECISGYHGYMCNKMCPTACEKCNKDTGACLGALVDDDDDDSTGVIVAIVIALIIVLIIIIIAICCWRRRQSGDYIVEDEEMDSPVGKSNTLDVKTSMNLQPVSPYLGRSTDMIDMDERQHAAKVYEGPSKADMMDRNPDGKSTSSDSSKSKKGPDDDGDNLDSDDDAPATGIGAPIGRKQSSLKITLSREKQPLGQMSPKSPEILVINDKTGELLTPMKIVYPETSVFVMPETSLSRTMAPLASEEDLLSGVGPKSPTSMNDEGDDLSPSIAHLGHQPDNEDGDEKTSKQSSSNSSRRSSKTSKGNGSKRSSITSDERKSNRSSKGSNRSSKSSGKKSKKSSTSSSDAISSGSDNEELKQYDENKDVITEM